MADETKDRHRFRVAISLPKHLWTRLGAFPQNRSEVVRTLVAWYLREPGARLPERPPRQD
jgi:metal-responsive CopG/Arc/MetJ family transcriptional regulator